MKPMSRPDYMQLLEERKTPRLPLVSVMPDLGRGYGWMVRVGVHDMAWCWTKVGAERVANHYRGGAYDSRADGGVVRGGARGGADRGGGEGGELHPADAGHGAALYGLWLLLKKWWKNDDKGRVL
jgi:hypothetical protein